MRDHGGTELFKRISEKSILYGQRSPRTQFSRTCQDSVSGPGFRSIKASHPPRHHLIDTQVLSVSKRGLVFSGRLQS